MNNQPYISTTDEPTIFLNGKQLAQNLGVSAPTLSEAVKNGYNCGGHPVSEWAEKTASGRIKGYHVPAFLVSEETTEKPEKRTNPKPEPTTKTQNTPNEAEIAPNKGDKDVIPAEWHSFIDQYVQEQPPRVDVHNPSILPKGQNYAEPVGMASLASVLKKALETHTPESRMLIFMAATGFGSLIGHTVNDNGWGAAAGALSSVGMMYFAYKCLTQQQNNPNQSNLALEEYNRMQVNRNFRKNRSQAI